MLAWNVAEYFLELSLVQTLHLRACPDSVVPEDMRSFCTYALHAHKTQELFLHPLFDTPVQTSSAGMAFV